MDHKLRFFLNQLHDRYHRPGFLSSDPLEFVHRYSDPWDQEVVAILSALLAYGKVKQIRRSVEETLGRIEKLAATPALFIRGLGDPASCARAGREFKTFTHRFNRGSDLMILFGLIHRSWKEYGSVGGHFLTYLDQDDVGIETALNRLMSCWRGWVKGRVRAKSGSFDYLLTSPEDGSCCKRWCMLIRWMGRRDDLDPGLWAAGSALSHTFPPGRILRADQLVIPLDTHTGRISQYLGLTQRKSLGWKAALEVTDALRECNSGDPVRYDFALSRLGILDLCQRKYRREICEKCDLFSVCRLAQAAPT